jgi:hypothetical protein
MEQITLKCRCGNQQQHANLGGAVDLAEFLRCALGAGWIRIDENPVSCTWSEGVTEIELYGQCANCAAIEADYLQTVPKEARFWEGFYGDRSSFRKVP